jgi:hypothetical protein
MLKTKYIWHDFATHCSYRKIDEKSMNLMRYIEFCICIFVKLFNFFENPNQKFLEFFNFECTQIECYPIGNQNET